jgi:hypothetical protein
LAYREDRVPAEWKALVEGMRAHVHKEEAESDGIRSWHDGSVEERRGYLWNFQVSRVAYMLEYLTRTIRDDLLFGEHSTLASMLLLDQAIQHLELELQDGGHKGGREDRDENRMRVLNALKALTPRFDDVHMLRLRALQVAEGSVKMTHILDDDEVEERVESVKGIKGFNVDHHRDFIKHDQPLVDGLLARSLLAEVDSAFGEIDPLVVMEEFGEAEVEARGGRADNGDGRVGPVRALARLAVMCGALGFSVRPGEEFDAAVDRVRANLLMTRSRFRKTLREFPGQQPPDGDGDGASADGPGGAPETGP